MKSERFESGHTINDAPNTSVYRRMPDTMTDHDITWITASKRTDRHTKPNLQIDMVLGPLSSIFMYSGKNSFSRSVFRIEYRLWNN